MEILKKLKTAAEKNKISYINIIPSEKGEEGKSVIVALLPYYAGEKKSYLSKYTRGEDYHILGRRIMENILEESQISYNNIYIDISPYNERKIALRAGLGVLGKNGLLINKDYGSFVFIMTAFTDIEVDTKPQKIKHCIDCGNCIKACPGHCITNEGINYNKCLSFITQKRHIDIFEEEKIKENNYAWGCDRCQDVCPMNKNIKETPFKELKENLLLSLDDIDILSNKEFLNKYKKYALCYRGKKVLKRNIDLLKSKKEK